MYRVCECGCDCDGSKEDVKTQGRRVVFIRLQQEPCLLTHSHTLPTSSLDSEPQDVSAGTLVITRGWPWQRRHLDRRVFVNAERVCMRREPICSIII